jgi:hydrogenase expression/formation protein HypD
MISMSGYRIRDEFARWDAERVFDIADTAVEEPAECISALVLQGLKKPVDCPAFGVRCTPENPLGAPMVSAEGACSAYYQYRRRAARG